MIANGPPVIDHGHTTPHPTPQVTTMINSKSTKAQLLEYIGQLQADIDTLEQELIAARPVSPTDRLTLVREEIAAAVNDAIRFERWCANGFQRILDELKSLRYN